MGKAAGAALTVVAPEASAARAAASGRRRRPPAADPRVTAPGSKAAQQRQAIEKIKASRPAQPPVSPATESPAPTSSGTGPSAPALPAGTTAAASTGSGFLLGVIAWALALNYLQGGLPQVRKFAAAKLFNKV